MNTEPVLDELEKEEKFLYFNEYTTRPEKSEISKNFGIAYYDIFSEDLSQLTQEEFHLQEIKSVDISHGSVLEFVDFKTNSKMLPKQISELLNLENKTVLDFGCGRGKFCNDAVNKFNATKAYGTDLATVDLGLVDQYRSENCEFIGCGATSIPLPDKSVNITTAFLVLEHVHEHNIDKMFEELCRVTKDGFVFSISHGEANRKNLRRCSKKLNWWYEKVRNFSDGAFVYYPEKDQYKWGLGRDVGLSRLICHLK